MSVYKQPYLKLFNCITDIIGYFYAMSEETADRYKQIEETQQLSEDLYIEADDADFGENDIYRKPYLRLFNAATDVMTAMQSVERITQSEYIKLIESQQEAEELYLLNSEG